MPTWQVSVQRTAYGQLAKLECMSHIEVLLSGSFLCAAYRCARCMFGGWCVLCRDQQSLEPAFAALVPVGRLCFCIAYADM